jgi:uncharacterized membrane protein
LAEKGDRSLAKILVVLRPLTALVAEGAAEAEEEKMAWGRETDVSAMRGGEREAMPR